MEGGLQEEYNESAIYMMSNSLVLNDVIWEAMPEQYLSISNRICSQRICVLELCEFLMHLRGMFSKAFLLG